MDTMNKRNITDLPRITCRCGITYYDKMTRFVNLSDPPFYNLKGISNCPRCGRRFWRTQFNEEIERSDHYIDRNEQWPEDPRNLRWGGTS